MKFVPEGPIDNNPALFEIDNGLALNKRQAIIWTNADPIHWRIYAALWGDGYHGAGLTNYGVSSRFFFYIWIISHYEIVYYLCMIIHVDFQQGLSGNT